MQWIVHVELDPTTGDLLVPLPTELLDQLQWTTGDQIEILQHTDHIILRKIQ